MHPGLVCSSGRESAALSQVFVGVHVTGSGEHGRTRQWATHRRRAVPAGYSKTATWLAAPVIAGLLLVLSSVSHTFAASIVGEGSFPWRWVGPAVAVGWYWAQATVGCWLIGWPRDQLALYFGAALYAGFVVYLAVVMLGGGDPWSGCSCFAFWSPPLLVVFLVDAGLLGVLIGEAVFYKTRPLQPVLRRVVLGGAVAGSGLLLAAGAGRLAPAVLRHLMPGQIVVGPGQWYGRLPEILTLFAVDQDNVYEGRWLLVFVHGECSRCHRFVRELAARTEPIAGVSPTRWLVLDTSTAAGEDAVRWPIRSVRLRPDRVAIRLRMAVPTVVLLDAGRVITVAVQPEGVEDLLAAAPGAPRTSDE